MSFRGGLIAVAVLACGPAAAAPARAAAPAPPAFSENGPVVTHQQILLAGKPLRYVAEAGRVAIRDVETGEPHGYMFYVAYRVPTTGKPRPVTFVWNGGPGANASTLHFNVVGPKRAEDGRLVDNAETWLADTDLVFVDPIGTGFSRPAKSDYAQEFYGTVGDVASVTEFVRSWRLLHGAEDTPLYLAGESWGSGRAADVSYALEKRRVKVDGLVLISGGIGARAPDMPRELSQALRVVDLSATAFHYGKTPPELGKDLPAVRATAETWARQTYAPALAHPEALSEEERTAVVGKLAAFTGLKPDQIDRRTLSFTPRQYLTGLLKDQGKTLNVFDMRLTAEPREAATAAILHYLRHDLGYRTDLPYVDTERLDAGYAPTGKYPEGVGSRWVYATVPVTPEALAAAKAEAEKRGGGPPSIGPPLPATAEALTIDPHIKVLVASGLYNFLNSCTANAETGRRLPAAIRGQFEFHCYVGGHMMYRVPESRLQLSRDVRALIAKTP